MANTKKRVLSLLMALVMTLGLLPISALAEEIAAPDYELGATVQTETAEKPTGNIPEGSYWDGPVKTDAAITGDLICEETEHTHVTKTSCTHTHTDECYSKEWVLCTKEANPDHYRRSGGHKTGTSCKLEWGNEGHDYYGYQLSKNPTQCEHKHSAEQGCVTENMLCENNGCTLEEHTHDTDPASSTCCYKVTPAFYTWTLKAFHVDSVTIEDTIATAGCLTAKVTGYAVSYQWYENGKPIVGATGKTLSAFDKEHNAVITAPNQYTVKAFANDSEETSEAYTAKYYTKLMNGSFEKPEVTSRAGYQQFKNDDKNEPDMHWLTTGLGVENDKPDKDIELVRKDSYWHFGERAVNMPDGNQCAEVNAEAYGALYQDVLTQPDSTLYWSFAHRGRVGTDTLVLVIAEQSVAEGIKDCAKADAKYKMVTAEDGNEKWSSYSSGDKGYKVPDGQYVTRFYFAAVQAAGNSTMGNLLDNISFSSEAPAPKPEQKKYTIQYYVDGALQGNDTDSANAEVGATVRPSKLENYANYDAAKENQESLTITAEGPNTLNLYFTTPAYTVEYYINSATVQDKYTEVTDTAVLGNAPTGGKALYGTAISQTGIPAELLANNNKYKKDHTDGDTMTRESNVLKVYYNFEKPVVYTVNYDWTSDSHARPDGFVETLPASDTTIPDLAGYTVKALPALSPEQTTDGYTITGWFTDENGENLLATDAVLEDNQTLYAHCNYTEPSKYSVTYRWATDSKEPIALPDSLNNITLTELQSTTVPAMTGAAEGYSFEGWYTDAGHEYKFTDKNLEKQTDSIILYAYFTYKAPTHPYTVNYELYLAQDGGNYPTKPETVTIVDNVPVTFDALPTLAKTYDDTQDYSYKENSYTKGTAEDDKRFEGTWAGNNLVYTIKLYATHYTVGSLKITKNINGLNEKALETLKGELSFTVTGPKDYNETFKYSEVFKDGSYTIEGLTPDTYTVKENNAAVGGYALTATDKLSADVTAQAEPAAISITNTYESKTYTITFDAGKYGKANDVTGTDSYAWREFTEGTGDSATKSYGFAKTGNVAGTGSKIVYTIEYADYLTYQDEMSVAAPKLEADKGYTIDSRFTNVLDGEYNTLMQAMKTMVDNDKTAATYTAAYTPNEKTNYDVKYFYQNVDGSYNVAPTEVISRQGKTDTTVTVTAGDTEKRDYKGQSYVFDKTQANLLSDTVNGNGTTALKVYFKWQAGVTYEYEVKSTQKFPDKILATLTLPKDGEYYDRGAKVKNKGVDTIDYSDPAGTWTLTWGQKEVPMEAGGITFVGTWTFASVGQATVKVQFVDEAGNDITTAQTPYFYNTGKEGTPYDFAAAKNVDTIEKDGYTYDFIKAYVGEIEATDANYKGTIPENGLTIKRVYNVKKAAVMVEKTYNIGKLPEGFAITATDTIDGTRTTLALADAQAGTSGKMTWNVELPIGRTYTFTESGYSNGAGWSTVLTAQQAEGQHATPRMVLPSGYTMKDLTVNGYSFTATVTTNDLVGGDGVMIAMHNAYSYTAPIDPQPIPPTEPDNDPEEGYGPGENPLENIVSPEVPLAELPETEIPLTELPETEVPLAEAPATGDNLAMWIMAAAISGLSLVWLMISGKKREDENAE